MKHASATYWSILRLRPRNFLCTSRGRRSVPENREIAADASKTSAVRGDATSGAGNSRVYIRVWFSAWTEKDRIDSSSWRIRMTKRIGRSFDVLRLSLNVGITRFRDSCYINKCSFWRTRPFLIKINNGNTLIKSNCL